MTGFIIFEAMEQEEEEQESNNFIDDNIYDQSSSNYRLVDNAASNVTLSYEKAMALAYSEDKNEEFSSFAHSNEPYPERVIEFDQAKVIETRFKIFLKALNKNAKRAKIVFSMQSCGEPTLS